MGYTHFWYVTPEINLEIFSHIRDDFSQLIPIFKKDRISLGDAFGNGEPVLNDDLVAFNGVGPNSHESVYFPRIHKEEDILIQEKGRVFNFCKTNRKPYDLAVMSFLIIAKHYLKDDIVVRSDGYEWDFEPAKKLISLQFGYGNDFTFDNEEEDVDE